MVAFFPHCSFIYHLHRSANNEKLGWPMWEQKAGLASDATQVMNSNSTSAVFETQLGNENHKVNRQLDECSVQVANSPHRSQYSTVQYLFTALNEVWGKLMFTVCKRSCGKVMFSQACVKNSVHRGEVYTPVGRHFPS